MDPTPLKGRDTPCTIWEALELIKHEIETLRSIVDMFYNNYTPGRHQALDIAHSMVRVYLKGE